MIFYCMLRFRSTPISKPAWILRAAERYCGSFHQNYDEDKFSYGQYYRPHPVDLLSIMPADKMTVVAFRVSRESVHYAQAEIDYAESLIRVLESKAFPINTDRVSSSKYVQSSEQIVQQSEPNIEDLTSATDKNGNGDGEKTAAKGKPKKWRRNNSIIDEAKLNSIVADMVENSPSADAYVVEKIPHGAFRTKDRSLLRLYASMGQYIRVLRTHLVTKWRSSHKHIHKENTDMASSVQVEPVFESNASLVEETFQLRKSGALCESLTKIVRRLPYGFPTGKFGVIHADISTEIKNFIYNRVRNENVDMEKHLTSAVILESVVFATYLMWSRGRRPVAESSRT